MSRKTDASSSLRLSGARIVVETLCEQGVSEIFGYPGALVLPLYDALYGASGRIRHYLTSHEQHAVHAADGYARVSGRVGVVWATSGPGATNLVTGLATAMLDSIPIVAITGNVSTSQIGRDCFQEVNITGITLPITKHNYFVTDVGELADTLREAFRIAKSGRPGPVLVDIPYDVQQAETGWCPGEAVPPFRQPVPSEASLSKAVSLIAQCERPYVYVGGGAAAADVSAEIDMLAERTDGYIGCTLMGLSVTDHRNRRFLGMSGVYGNALSSAMRAEADLIIGIGVRFSDRAAGLTPRIAPDVRIVQLDVDPSEINKNVRVDAGLAGDIRESLRRMMPCVTARRRPAWARRLGELRAALCVQEPGKGAGGLHPQSLIAVINEEKSDETVVATDVGQHQMWTAQGLSLSRPRHFLTSGGLGTMGYGLGAATGAYVACGCPTVLVTGDGSFGMNCAELATLSRYGIPVVIVLLNNGVLGMVRQWQTRSYDGRYSQTDLAGGPDYVRLASAYGIDGCRVSDAAEFRRAFRSALSSGRPALIEAVIDRDETVPLDASH